MDAEISIDLRFLLLAVTLNCIENFTHKVCVELSKPFSKKLNLMYLQ